MLAGDTTGNWETGVSGEYEDMTGLSFSWLVN